SQALAQHVEAFQLSPSRELIAQSAIDIAAQRVERIQSPFQVLDNHRSWFQRRKLAGEIFDRIGNAGRLRRAGLCRGDLIGQRVDLRLDLCRLPEEAARLVEEDLDLALIGAKLVEEGGGLFVRGVDRLNFVLQRVEILALLGQAIELPLRALGRFLQAVQA